MLKNAIALASFAACLFFLPGSLLAQDLEYNQFVTPAHISTSPLSKDGDGNPAGNGGFTVHRLEGVELGLRARLLDGDAQSVQQAMVAPGVYRFEPGTPDGEPPGSRKPRWVFDWSFNVDYEGMLGRNLNGLNYRIFLDGDPGIGTEFLDFNPLGASPAQVPFDIRCLIAFGNNQTGEGQGVAAGGLTCDNNVVVALRNNNNVMQNSCNYDCPRFETGALEFFDPEQPGLYTIVLEASSGDSVVARTEILVLVGAGLLDLELAGPLQLIQGQQGDYEARLSNIAEAATDEPVEFILEVDGAQGDAGAVEVEYCVDSQAAGSAANCSDWQALSLVADGALLRGRFGPDGGFHVDQDYDETTFLRAAFSQAGPIRLRTTVQEVTSELALATDEIDISVTGQPSVQLEGLESNTLRASFSVEVVATGLSGDAASWNGQNPVEIVGSLASVADKALFLETFFGFDADLHDLVDDWDQVLISAQPDEMAVSLSPGLFALDYSLDLGNTGAIRAEAAWAGTEYLETLTSWPLTGPSQPEVLVEFTVPYSQESGADYDAPVQARFIDPAKPLIRPQAPGIESGSWTIEPTAIDFAFGDYASGISASYSFDGEPMGSYASGQILNTVGEYVVVVTNDSNPGVEPGAQTTVRFTRESLAAGASGSIEVLARQSSLDGQVLVQSGQVPVDIMVELVTVSPQLELVLMFDGDAEDGPGGEAVCESLLTTASCSALNDATGFDNPFVSDISLFSDMIEVRPDAPLGDWTLAFYLLAVDGNGEFDLVTAAIYGVRVETDGLFSDRFEPAQSN